MFSDPGQRLNVSTEKKNSETSKPDLKHQSNVYRSIFFLSFHKKKGGSIKVSTGTNVVSIRLRLKRRVESMKDLIVQSFRLSTGLIHITYKERKESNAKPLSGRNMKEQ